MAKKSDMELRAWPEHAKNQLTPEERRRRAELFNQNRTGAGNRPVSLKELQSLEARVEKLETALAATRRPKFFGKDE